jgi:hypothetical protein
MDSVEASRSGLQATLLVRNPDNPQQYVVNFDREVMQLIREAKVLSRCVSLAGIFAIDVVLAAP